MPQNKKKCLNLGCWTSFIFSSKDEEWTNIDSRDIPHPSGCRFRRMDISSLDFPSESIDYIYACHVLEHVSRWKTKDIIAEWHRVLKPGGMLRVAVPDFDALHLVYARTRDLSLIIGPLYGRQDYEENTHYTTFNFGEIDYCLGATGFKNICRYDHRETSHARIDDYSASYIPHKDFENGICVSLNVQAIKS